MAASDKDSATAELRVVLNRTQSSRTEEHGFQTPEADKQIDKHAPQVAEEKPKQEQPRKRRDPVEEKRPLSEILKESGRRALGGGLPGAMAMGVQVVSLMWLRTTMNYQYRYGTSTSEALKALYKDGGIMRFYRGLGPALLQGPLSRFGDTASNAGMLSLLNQHESTEKLPVAVKTGAASLTAGAFRIFLMPVDTLKTILQVEGKNGLPILREKISKGGIRVIYHGALGAAGATAVGHYPWFATHNILQEKIPKRKNFFENLIRNAGIGFFSSLVSDCTSNSIRVVKTTKQTAREAISYTQAVKMVVDADGITGLFFRGLGTRLLANGFQASREFHDVCRLVRRLVGTNTTISQCSLSCGRALRRSSSRESERFDLDFRIAHDPICFGLGIVDTLHPVTSCPSSVVL